MVQHDNCRVLLALHLGHAHNMVNETSDITETTGPAWVTPEHDRAGNMTAVPLSLDATAAMTCTYHARHRLVRTECDNEGNPVRRVLAAG